MKAKIILFCLLFLGTGALSYSCSDDIGETETEQPGGNDDNGDAGNGDDTGGDNIGDGGDDIDTGVEPPSDTDGELAWNAQDLSLLGNAVFVMFSGSGDATVSELANVTSKIEGNHVTIASTADAGVNYVLTGVTANGSVTFTSDNKFNLYLNGTGITNPSGAAINSTQKAVSVVIQDKTQNRLVDAANSKVNAALYSKGKMDFSGGGLLEVRGKAKHAIGSGNEVVINGGSIFVKEAVSDAIHGDGISITGGTITAYAAGDGLDGDDIGSIDISGGGITIVTTGEKGHAIKTSSDDTTGEKGAITITGGTFDITTTGIASKAINSDDDITIGGGNLLLKTTGDAFYYADEKDTSSAAGIKCGGDLLIENDPKITIKSTGSGGKGINVDGAITIDGGAIEVYTTGSVYGESSSSGGFPGGPGGGNSSSTVDTSSSPKGISAEGAITINGGHVAVSSANHEGIESKVKLTINGGTVESVAGDDGLNVSDSNGSIVINGGMVYVYGANNNSSGGGGGSMEKPGDGIDSNGTISITGGVVVVSNSGSPDEAFDCDTRSFSISGGVVIGTGGQHSTLPNAGTQYSIAWGGASMSAGEYVQLKNASGETLFVYRMPRATSDMKMIVSHHDLAKGAYTFVKGGSYAPGKEEFHGYYTGGTYSGGTSTSLTITSTVTKVGSLSSTGTPGGRP